MKKKIEDYYDQNVGIKCENEEEWKAICDLTKDNRNTHPARNDFMEHGYNCIGIYKNQHGWSTEKSYKIIYPALDLLEETEITFPIFN